MQTALEAKGVQFVGVAIDEADKVRQYAKKAGINYPILIGEFDATELGKVLGNKGGALPFTVIFDRGGRVVKTILGGTNESHLTPILQPYL
jgi:peroxiredoxin